uniref:ATP synthase membrane subunit DAPIT n=1 Tax=Felis catus TaxID=9685 RepID=A0ABI7W204_FELCA
MKRNNPGLSFQFQVTCHLASLLLHCTPFQCSCNSRSNVISSILPPLFKPKIEIMAGPETDAQFQFTGIKKYFNSYTLTGRMNCVLATYGGIALMVLYFKLRSKKTPAVKAT